MLARNSAAAEKRGRAKIPSPQPPSFLPARARRKTQTLQIGWESRIRTSVKFRRENLSQVRILLS
ncbi:MAG: hypothetical protein A3A16_03435 [Candidatus Harrisonbacteria bacterium RIFCSPLOWO2_01_FULL_44_18]|uniref:Uncharacterized protein n=1 Tax=Candidatus Harrisonbacteria bacterium RIFCSPLOWO2_01_FULL_44_18 TaxID=1798407 RepID=A0A1G1ZP75_9BACT|nr:MAG: hypothetical protein A3A16_03435 [Candidatus Harrisonbacteria bacterium RIFCSPLOWO2_01_FULL_44_18]